MLILYAWARPSTNLPSTLLALALAALHLAAALGTALRRPWGRVAGMVVGWIGVLGTGAVLVLFALLRHRAAFELRAGGQRG